MTSHRLRETPAEPVTVDELVLALHELPGVGDSAIDATLRGAAIHRMRPSDVPGLTASQLEELFALKPKQAAIIARGLGSALPRARELVRRMRGSSITVLTSEHAAYPQRLVRTMERPPTVLYGSGNLDALGSAMVAVLTSNGAPREAREAATAALAVAVEGGFVPVTGHNRPEYQDVALAARRRDVPTCYVLDRGILTVPGVAHGEGLFPAARIWRRSDDSPGDLALSALHPTMPATPGSNRRRDEIVAGLAAVILIAHIRQGGTMHRIVERSAASGIPVLWTRAEAPPTFLSDCIADSCEPDALRTSSAWLRAMHQAGLSGG